MKTIRVGIIGAGGMAQVHARAYQKDQHVMIVGCADVDSKKAFAFAKQFSIPSIYQDFREMLEEEAPDAVSITTPNHIHGYILKEVLSRGIHVLVEKPMVPSLLEMEEIQKIVHTSASILQVGHMWRFHPDVEFIKQIIKEGYIGEIFRIKSYALLEGAPGGTIGSGQNGTTWFVQKNKAGGGALLDMGIHSIDLISFLLENIKLQSVSADLATIYAQIDVEDTGFLKLEYDRGIVATVETGWFQPHMDGVEASTQIFGSKGYARIFPTSVKYRLGSKWGEFLPQQLTAHDSEIPYVRQIEYFLECIRSGQKSLVGMQEAKTALEIIDAAYRSSKSGMPIHFSERTMKTEQTLRRIA